MSPGKWGLVKRYAGFPRVSGDEPLKVLSSARISVFSPRERG